MDREDILEKIRYVRGEFQAVNDLKNELDYLDDDDLKIIEDWLEEFREKINYLAAEYNTNDSIDMVEVKEKSTREQFEELKANLSAIRNASKSMQPEFVGAQKKNKKAILERLGFVETLGAKPSRHVYIHPSLVGKYYDTLKEYLRVSRKLKEEYLESLKSISSEKKLEIKKDEEIKDDNKKNSKVSIPEIEIDPLIMKRDDFEKNEHLDEVVEPQTLEEKRQFILDRLEENKKVISDILSGVNMGKKDYITYKKKKYWVPKKYINKFRLYMYKKSLLEEELRKINALLEKEYVDLESRTVVAEDKEKNKVVEKEERKPWVDMSTEELKSRINELDEKIKELWFYSVHQANGMESNDIVDLENELKQLKAELNERNKNKLDEKEDRNSLDDNSNEELENRTSKLEENEVDEKEDGNSLADMSAEKLKSRINELDEKIKELWFYSVHQANGIESNDIVDLENELKQLKAELNARNKNKLVEANTPIIVSEVIEVQKTKVSLKDKIKKNLKSVFNSLINNVSRVSNLFRRKNNKFNIEENVENLDGGRRR